MQPIPPLQNAEPGSAFRFTGDLLPYYEGLKYLDVGVTDSKKDNKTVLASSLELDYEAVDTYEKEFDRSAFFAKAGGFGVDLNIRIQDVQNTVNQNHVVYIYTKYLTSSRSCQNNRPQWAAGHPIVGKMAINDQEKVISFLNSYGSHYVHKTYEGAMIIIRAEASRKEYTSLKDFELALRASFVVSAEVKKENQEARESIKSKAKLSIRVIGKFNIKSNNKLIASGCDIKDIYEVLQNNMPLSIEAAPLYADVKPYLETLHDYPDIYKLLKPSYIPKSLDHRITYLENNFTTWRVIQYSANRKGKLIEIDFSEEYGPCKVEHAACALGTFNIDREGGKSDTVQHIAVEANPIWAGSKVNVAIKAILSNGQNLDQEKPGNGSIILIAKIKKLP